jgi:hypothetical protein
MLLTGSRWRWVERGYRTHWTAVVQKVAELTGSVADEIRHDARKLEVEEARDAVQWIDTLIQRQREE